MKNGSLLTIALLFVFTNFLSAQNVEWVGGVSNNWSDAGNWTGTNTPPTDDDDTQIAINASVTLSSAGEVEALQLGDTGETGNLTITSTGSLTTRRSFTGGDAIHIFDGTSGNENTLTINGSLTVSQCKFDGIDVNMFTSLSIGSTGSYTFNGHHDDGGIGSDAMEIGDDFSNSGTVTITNPDDSGISIGSDAIGESVSNSGSITISGSGQEPMAPGHGIVIDGAIFTNNSSGTVTVSNAGGSLVTGSGTFVNNGTFKGDGTIAPATFDFGTGTLAPGTSTGTITFDGNTTFTSTSNLELEIDGTNDYDQIIVNGNLDLNGVALTPAGSHTPAMGESFTLIDVVGGTLSGTFDGIVEGGAILWNTQTLYISYTGNQVTASFDAPLPVELIDFNARPIEGDVKLSWTTANEENNDYFTLERSTDGRNFEAIAMVSGNGNTTAISKYIHMDDNPARGLNYYRLKQTDYDGSFSYSDIETAEFEEEETIKIYPTVAHDVLNVVFGGDSKNDQQIVIRDLTGREYKSLVISSNKSKNEISLSELVPGSYFVAIYDDEKVSTFKFIKL